MEIKSHFLFMVFIFQVVISVDPNNQYCNIPRCQIGEHTMCAYPELGPHRRCERVIRSGLKEIEKEWILFVHNFYRGRVFNGMEGRGTPGPQPSAFEDLKLEWDGELAIIAQRWANQCKQTHDKCRHVDQFYVGQNIILDDFDEDMNQDWQLRNMQELMESWYNEVTRFNKNYVRRFRAQRARNSNTLNYTQMVWGETYKIGCGAIRYHKRTSAVPKIFLVCNYGPRGNCDGQSVYFSFE